MSPSSSFYYSTSSTSTVPGSSAVLAFLFFSLPPSPSLSSTASTCFSSAISFEMLMISHLNWFSNYDGFHNWFPILLFGLIFFSFSLTMALRNILHMLFLFSLRLFRFLKNFLFSFFTFYKSWVLSSHWAGYSCAGFARCF